jgi:hypothetical protein
MQANLPTLGRSFCVGPIGNTNADNVKDEMKEVKTQASNLGLKFYQSTRALLTVDDIHPVMQDLKANGVQALFVCTDPLVTSNADIVNEWAVIEKPPTMHAKLRPKGYAVLGTEARGHVQPRRRFRLYDTARQQAAPSREAEAEFI